jgi:hypothetical protein
MKRWMLLIMLGYTTWGCSPGFKIQTDTPFPGDFTDYRTFKFFNPANMPASNFSFDEEAKQVIFDAVADEMKARGYRSIQQADLMLKIYGGTKSSSEIRSNRSYDPYYDPYNRFGNYYNDPFNSPRNESQKESVIIIDMIDTHLDKVVWQGVGIGSFGKNQAIDALKLREAISAIFAAYPHTAGG